MTQCIGAPVRMAGLWCAGRLARKRPSHPRHTAGDSPNRPKACRPSTTTIGSGGRVPQVTAPAAAPAVARGSGSRYLKVWRHLRTSNVGESPFAALRLRTDAAKRFKKVANATAVV